MVKYLTQKGLVFWYRRRLKGRGEIIFSLETKNYDVAMLRHSYIDYKIKKQLLKGLFDTMNWEEIREVINEYREFVKSDDFIYGEEGKARGKALEIKINGEVFPGHTKTALHHKISEYGRVSQFDNDEKVREHTKDIIARSKILSEAYSKVKGEKDKNYFCWKVLKEEVMLLNKAAKKQDKYFGEIEVKNQIALNPSQPIQTNRKTISISDLTKKYVAEKSKTKEWGNKNEEDILYVLETFEEYFSPKTANELTRDDFLEFRDDVLTKMPKTRRQNAFKGKSTIDITRMKNIPPKKGSNAKPKEIIRIDKPTINKHIGRVSQVFAWAADEAGLIDKNFCSNLRYAKPQTSQQKKNKKPPFRTNDLKQWFEISPYFTSKLKTTLANKPEFIFIPLIALYLGARNAELTQLHYKDIKEIDNIWCINITDFTGNPGERKKTKNENSRRTIPIADGLIDIGFLKYVQSRKNKLLFPAITYTKGDEPVFTSRISDYIRKHIRQPEETTTFLSFRHMVNQKLKNTKTPLYIINDITGHSDREHGENDIDVKIYGDKQMPLEILQEVINKSLVYDEIDFSHIKEEIHQRYK